MCSVKLCFALQHASYGSFYASATVCHSHGSHIVLAWRKVIPRRDSGVTRSSHQALSACSEREKSLVPTLFPKACEQNMSLCRLSCFGFSPARRVPACHSRTRLTSNNTRVRMHVERRARLVHFGGERWDLQLFHLQGAYADYFPCVLLRSFLFRLSAPSQARPRDNGKVLLTGFSLQPPSGSSLSDWIASNQITSNHITAHIPRVASQRSTNYEAVACSWEKQGFQWESILFVVPGSGALDSGMMIQPDGLEIQSHYRIIADHDHGITTLEECHVFSSCRLLECHTNDACLGGLKNSNPSSV